MALQFSEAVASIPPDSLLQMAASSPASASAPTSRSRPVAGPNPGVAISLALMPGVAVHGAGHFYAGRPLTGAALVAVELGSLYLMYRGGTGVYDAVNGGAFDTESRNVGGSEEFSRGAGFAVAGLILFLASWLYDLTGSPIAAEETTAAKNKKVNQSLTLTPQLQTGRAGVLVEQRF